MQNKCKFNRHNWISVDADGYDLTLCRKCRVSYDYDALSIWEKIKNRYEDYTYKVPELKEPPF